MSESLGLEVQINISGTEVGTGYLRVGNQLVAVSTYQMIVTDDETGTTTTYEVTRHSALDSSGNRASSPEDMVTYEPAGDTGTYAGVRSSRAYGEVIELRNSNNTDLRGDLFRSDNGEVNDELILIHVGGNYDHPTRGNVNVTSFGCFTLNGSNADMPGLEAFVSDVDNRVSQQQQGSEGIVITVDKTESCED